MSSKKQINTSHIIRGKDIHLAITRARKAIEITSTEDHMAKNVAGYLALATLSEKKEAFRLIASHLKKCLEGEMLKHQNSITEVMTFARINGIIL